VRGGDLAQLPDLIAYGEAVLAAATDLYEVADAANRVLPGGDLAAASVDLAMLREMSRFAAESQGKLESAGHGLREARALAAGIDPGRLSVGTRDAFLAVETTRGAIEAVVDVALDLAPLVSSIEAFDVAALEGAASLAESMPDLATRLSGPARGLAPYAGLSSEDVEGLLDHAVRLSRPVAGLLRGVIQAGDILGSGLPRGAESAERLDAVLGRIEASASEARVIATAPDRPEPAAAALDVLGEQLQRVEFTATVARDVLGFNGRRVIVVLGQDDEELRPGGGFIGAAWELEFDRGRMTASRVLSSYDVDEAVPVDRWMPAPDGFTLSFAAGVIPFRDQNWWPDFPYSAARMRETYESGQGRRPDFVVAVNQRSLAAILASTGPIEVGPGLAVSSETLRDYLRDGVEPRDHAASGTDPRRYAARLLGEGIIRTLMTGARIDLVQLALNASRITSDGDLLIDAEAQPARSALRALGWDGSVRSFPGDGWYWAEGNAYSPKSSQEIIREVEQKVVLRPDGSSLNTLTVRYENPLDGSPHCVQPSQPPYGPCYWLFGWLLLPPQARVVSIPRFDLPGGAVAAGRTSYAVGAATVRTGPLGDHLAITALAVVPPDSSREWEFVYRVPGAATPVRDLFRYSSRVERQPGMPPVGVTVEVSVPDNACIVAVDGVNQAPASTVSLAWALTRDRHITVDYSVDPARCGR
jgi:hypothetical protein